MTNFDRVGNQQTLWKKRSPANESTGLPKKEEKMNMPLAYNKIRGADDHYGHLWHLQYSTSMGDLPNVNSTEAVR